MDSIIIIFSSLLAILSWSLYQKRLQGIDLRNQYNELKLKIEEKNDALKKEARERRQAETILKASELRNRLIIYSAQITVWEWELGTNEMLWNENLTELFGHPLGQTRNTKQWWLHNIHPDDLLRISNSIDEYLMLGHGIWREEYRFRRFDGDWSCVIHWGMAIADEEGKPIRVVGAMMDITARKQAEERLLESELNLLEAQRIAHLGSWVWNLNNDELEWSKEQRRIFGYPLESGNLVYQNFIDAIFPEDKELVLKAIEQAKKTGKISDLEVRIQRPDGSKHWISIQGEAITDESGTPEKMVGTSIDITERKLLEEQLKYQAVHDQLTGLYNRRVLQERLTAEGARATRYNHPLAVFMLDVDHFKRINDTHGHLVGDLVLQTLASTLETSTRKTDVLARYGGEEFVVVLPETSLETAQLLAERLREAIADRAVMLEHGERIDVTASIGIACFPTHSRTPQDLLTIADRALYQAKQNGRNRVSTPNAPDHSTNVALELPST